jgi:hypothetical protein
MLWGTTVEKPIELQIKKRKWKRIGHTIRKNENAVERILCLFHMYVCMYVCKGWAINRAPHCDLQ